MRNPDVLRLRTVDQVAEDPAAPAEALAVGALTAVPAPSAGGDAGHQDTVPRPYGTHVRADLDDLADRFVAEDGSRAHLGDVPLQDVQVGPADGDGVDPHDGVGGFLEVGIGQILPRGPARTVEYVALHRDTHSLCSGASGARGPVCAGWAHDRHYDGDCPTTPGCPRQGPRAWAGRPSPAARRPRVHQGRPGVVSRSDARPLVSGAGADTGRADGVAAGAGGRPGP